MSDNFKTISIKGKDYVMVNERIKYFREKFPLWSLESEIVALDNEMCVVKAIIKDESGRVIANGIARELQADKESIVNKTSYVENCESSAWGRALANLAIGIDKSIRSADEVANAIKQQNGIKSSKELKIENRIKERLFKCDTVSKVEELYEEIKSKADISKLIDLFVKRKEELVKNNE